MLLSLVAAACGLAILLTADGDDMDSTAAQRALRVTAPRPPGDYRLPRRAVRVDSSRELRAALARRRRTSIVLAAGTYRGRRPFPNPHGHRLYAARTGKAVLTAGLSLGGNAGRGGAVVRGLTIDAKRATVDGAAIAVWGVARDVTILDVTLRGNRVLRAGISARRPEGLRIGRVRARGFTDYGVLVDANDPGRGPLAEPFALHDVDVARVARPDPGSSNGRAEACVWIGNTGSVRRVRARDCGWSGLWTGTATSRAVIDEVDVNGTRTGVYLEHFTRDSRFRRLRVGPDVRIGLTAEWADPAWGRRPASDGNLIERSRFESRLVGVYLDEGTTRTTVRDSSFANQSWAAIGDFRGNGNAYRANDYEAIDAGAERVRHDHLSTAREGR